MFVVSWSPFTTSSKHHMLDINLCTIFSMTMVLSILIWFIFIYSPKPRHIIIHVGLLVYVDDIIITWNFTTKVNECIIELTTIFSIKYLSFLHYFLSVEVIPTPTCLFISHHIYIPELFERTKMIVAKVVFTIGQETQENEGFELCLLFLNCFKLLKN